MRDFSGKVAVVTGASRGIGFAVAQELGARGATVIMTGRTETSIVDAADSLNQNGVAWAVPITAHVGRLEDSKRLVDLVMQRFGHIDVLINNAGTNPFFGPLLDLTPSAWDKTFEVNLRGAFFLTKMVIEASMCDRGGSIVNVASAGGLRTADGMGVYNVTKAALIHLTRQMATELGPFRIRVNAVAPAVIETKFAGAVLEDPGRRARIESSNPLRRTGTPVEVAVAIAFLASDAASYINGEVLVIDGGGGVV